MHYVDECPDKDRRTSMCVCNLWILPVSLHVYSTRFSLAYEWHTGLQWCHRSHYSMSATICLSPRCTRPSPVPSTSTPTLHLTSSDILFFYSSSHRLSCLLSSLRSPELLYSFSECSCKAEATLLHKHTSSQTHCEHLFLNLHWTKNVKPFLSELLLLFPFLQCTPNTNNEEESLLVLTLSSFYNEVFKNE